jgi:alpha-ketoglutarate-dependent 2,4-dichlorophenoxyacetate dioxygenase
MTRFDLTPLSPNFGIEVRGLDLMAVTAETMFPEIRALFEEHSALLFRDQTLTPEKHLELAGLFGPVEDREADARKPGETFKIPEVSNILDDGTTSGEMDLKTLNLKANFLWHSDSTFLPIPSLVNILVGKVVTTQGGATELASTRAAWAEMPADLKARIEGRGIWHRFSHSRKKISEELAKLPLYTKWPDQHWKAIWPNPVNGREALYIASHAFAVDGYDDAEGEALLEELTAFCTQPRFVYAHTWAVGDVLLWDQRAVLHRGTPWPYEQPRKLASICSTVRESDGIAAIRIEPELA